MELKQIKELMTAMERAGIKKLIVKEKTGSEVHLERHDEHLAPQTPVYHPPFAHREADSEVRHVSAAPKVFHEEKPQEVLKEGKYVTSPMVGTFYTSPSPDDPLFVKLGDSVEEGTVLCIIEAMKVMNEVKAGMKGVVAEILVANAQPVEFGTKLFRIV